LKKRKITGVQLESLIESLKHSLLLLD